MATEYVFSSVPDDWVVTMNDRSTVQIRAHAYGREDGCFTFTILMQGSPRFEVEVARFAISEVATVLSA